MADGAGNTPGLSAMSIYREPYAMIRPWWRGNERAEKRR